MTPKSLVCFLLALLVGSWLLLRFSGSNAWSDLKPPVPSTPLFSFDPKNVSKMIVFRESSHRILQLEQQDSMHWVMKDPVEDRADFSLIRQTMFQVLSAERVAAPESWSGLSDAELGLNPAKLTLEIYFYDSSGFSLQSTVLRVGAKSLDGQSFAGEVDGVRCRVPVSIFSWFDRDEFLWRDHGLLRDPGQVRLLSWEPVGGSRISVRKDVDGWKVTEPSLGLLRSNRVGTLMRLLGARIDSLPQEQLSVEGRNSIEEEAGKLSIYYSPSAKSMGVQDQIFWVMPDFILDSTRLYHLPVRKDALQFLSYSVDELLSRKFLNLDKGHLSSLGFVSIQEEGVMRSGAKYEFLSQTFCNSSRDVYRASYVLYSVPEQVSELTGC